MNEITWIRITIFGLFLNFVFWLRNQTCIVLNKFIGPKEEALLGYVLKYRIVIFNEQKGKKNEESLAALLVIGPPISSLAPPPLRWVLHVVDGPSALLMGPLHRHWALLGAPCCRWARRVVIGCSMLSMGLVHCRWAL